ncbi:hypothetical protein [Demequina sediminicola]|uniref:hypothetical protein n=1 Tax=Demequina sediminicola TaxID=1095026 RepID=UPI0007864B02|nr:hypothetical protein [Demequina sediminicola]
MARVVLMAFGAAGQGRYACTHWRRVLSHELLLHVLFLHSPQQHSHLRHMDPPSSPPEDCAIVSTAKSDLREGTEAADVICGIEWRFVPRDGVVGPDQKLLDYLIDNGLDFVVFLP